jgi:dTDP-4-dehydrorhamnose 3,5-epimerase
VLFVFKDSLGSIREEIIGEGNPARLTVPPGLWFGFKGINSNNSVILNISNIMHDDKEVERKEINEIDYDWKMS